jgi:hypothetical protein
MSFLSKAKETANKINDVAGTKPSLPGVKPSLPGARPPIPGAKPPVGKPPVLGAKPSIPGGKPLVVAPKAVESVVEAKVETAPLKNNNPFIKKPVAAPTVIGKTEEIKEEVVVKVEPVVATETKVEENTAQEVIAEKVEEIAKEEVKPAATNKRRRKPAGKAAAEEAVESDIDSGADTIEFVMPKSEVNFEDALLSIRSGFVDEAWEAFRTENITRLNDILISNDMTTTMIKSTLSELSLLRDSTWIIFNDTKTNFEILTGKEPEGTIERIKKMSAKGSNPDERKLNATLAVMNYKDANGRTVNLYELLDEMRERYNFTKSLMDAISYKNSVLITMLGSLKLEK